MSTLARARRLLATLDRDRLLLVFFTLLYATSGAFHLLVWAVDGGPWAGDITWRKPIVFGLSAAITTASLAWALGAVRPSAIRRRGVRIYVVAMTFEIALITMQRWRGVASHYNTTTAFDGLVFTAMGALIVIAAIPVTRWAIAATRDRNLPVEQRTAASLGLWLLVLGFAIGVVMSQLGSAGRMIPHAGMVAAAHDLVPAHAFALHGIQVVLLASLVLPTRVRSAALRILVMRVVALVWLVGSAVLVIAGVSS